MLCLYKKNEDADPCPSPWGGERLLCLSLTWEGRGHSIVRTRRDPRWWWGGGWCNGSSGLFGWGGSKKPAPRRRTAASPGRPRCSPNPSCRSRRRRSEQTRPPPGTVSSAAAPFPLPSSPPLAQWSLGHNRKTVGYSQSKPSTRTYCTVFTTCCAAPMWTQNQSIQLVTESFLQTNLVGLSVIQFLIVYVLYLVCTSVDISISLD